MDIALHIVGGAALASALIWNLWMAAPVLLVFGWLREQAQHRDEGFFGWMTGHRLFEAAQWGIGGLLASVGWHFFGPS